MDSSIESISSPEATDVLACAASKSAAEAARDFINQGRLLRTKGDRAGSLLAFRQAAAADPSNSTAVIECGYDHLHLVQIPDDKNAFEHGLTLEPDSKPALIGLGHIVRSCWQIRFVQHQLRSHQLIRQLVSRSDRSIWDDRDFSTSRRG
jgi:hypothetical protein